DFFTPGTAEAISAAHGLADVVISANTVANIADLPGFFAAVRRVMSPNGLLIVETQYALDMLQRTLLDVIYHEHVAYFSVQPLQSELRRWDMMLLDAERIAPKGGSIRLFIQPMSGVRSVSPRLAAMVREEEDAGLYDKALSAVFSRRIDEI